MSRHISALFSAWGNESKRRKEQRSQRIETMFLPAALEILESPPRPLGRIILWTIILAAISAIIWASLAKVDIVAVCEGRVVPRGRLQSIEVAETGIVRSLLVTEGDRVTKGQPLLELDPTYANADADASKSELATARLQRARAIALLQYADGKVWELDNEGEPEVGVLAAERALVQARIQGHEEKIASFEKRLTAAHFASRQAQSELDRINDTIPSIERQLIARRELADQGYAPRIQVDELEERLTTLRYQAQSSAAEINKTNAEAEMIRRDIAAETQGFRIDAATELSEAESIIATRTEIVEKAERRTALQTLTAPVDGIINEITLTTIGEVAQPGEPLITLVPEGDELIVEAFVLNRDVGFISKGNEVTIKLEAYPFMRYGYLEGQVEHISADSIVDQNRGLVYPARVKITGSRLRLENMRLTERDTIIPNKANRPVDNVDDLQSMVNSSASAELDSGGNMAHILSPGMAAAVEIKTGQRSVISFILSPIGKSLQTAGRER